MSMIFHKKSYKVIGPLLIFWMLFIAQSIKHQNIFTWIEIITFTLLVYSLIRYLSFLENIQLKYDKKEKKVCITIKNYTFFVNTNKEMFTDKRKSTFVIKKDYIIFENAMKIVTNGEEKLNFLKKIPDIEEIKNDKKFFLFLVKNKYFKWNLMLFFVMFFSFIVEHLS